MKKRRPKSSLLLGFSIRRLAMSSLLVIGFLRGISSSRIVTLGSIEIYSNHEWLPTKPIVYFKCQGGNKTILPDVKETHVSYVFKGEESWQPLTELPEKKCQRCGLYEADPIKHDDVFDEWELCSSDFVDGRYVHFKENEFNATFICPNCTASAGSTQNSPNHEEDNKNGDVLTVIFITMLTSMVAAGVGYIIYTFWQKRKREQDQARFLKLFEDSDDVEAELGLDDHL